MMRAGPGAIALLTTGLGLGFAMLAAVERPAAQTAAAALPAKKAALPAAKDPTPQCDRAVFRLAVDVGHTDESYGATSARGAREYDFNLRLAKLIKRQLVDAGFTSTSLLVAEGKAQASLTKRVAVTNRLEPELFLSIHHDSVPDKFLQKWEYEGETLGYSDRFRGHSIFISNDNPARAASLRFATMIGEQLKARGLRYTPHYTDPIMGKRQRILVDADAGVYRYDQLRVLKETHVPAVLLEAGSIINRDEELLLNSPEHRGLIASAIEQAVESYCASTTPHPQSAAARAPQNASNQKSAAAKPQPKKRSATR
jgi:N-acetylmuramoyl-L-alanine amidase